MSEADEYTCMIELMSVIISKERRNFPILETTNMYWIGCPEHAPLDWHLKGKNSHMCELDCLESFFYLILDMLGVLPWKGENVKEISLLKKRWSTNMMLSSHSPVDYKSLNGALESLYATLGGVRDWDEPYDFEVEIGKSPREYLVAKIVRTIDKVDFALGELEALEMRTQYKTSEDIQMEMEIRRNALFIDRYIQKDLINEDGQNSEVIISEA
uniref:Tau-tubulin kinase 1 n=1 Tax=Heterorhabditis bacteriophora TaxID=37862 RepID=A0A1I7WT93_HETBA